MAIYRPPKSTCYRRHFQSITEKRKNHRHVANELHRPSNSRCLHIYITNLRCDDLPHFVHFNLILIWKSPAELIWVYFKWYHYGSVMYITRIYILIKWPKNQVKHTKNALFMEWNYCCRVGTSYMFQCILLLRDKNLRPKMFFQTQNYSHGRNYSALSVPSMEVQYLPTKRQAICSKFTHFFLGFILSCSIFT